jgi:hypothetical protein
LELQKQFDQVTEKYDSINASVDRYAREQLRNGHPELYNQLRAVDALKACLSGATTEAERDGCAEKYKAAAPAGIQ